MPTIPIFLKEKQYQRLRELAKIRNVKIAFLVREAVDLYLNAISAEKILGGNNLVRQAPQKKVP
ncbi:MAG: hypothetical protein DRG59_03610 [Deltaproteobacteria bacterium]|nr:MAG: hypothetical protein DRG59_03610 [Deltaproteobacteria bacterium]